MTWEQICWTQLLQELYGEAYDSSYIPEWYDRWSDYEECGHLFILRRDQQFFILRWAYSVMADDNNIYWDPYPVTEEEALEEMIEWETAQKQRDGVLNS